MSVSRLSAGLAFIPPGSRVWRPRTCHTLYRATASAYDAANRLVGVTDPRNAVTSYGYDKVGNRTMVTDPLNNVTVSVYDKADRLVEEIDPLNHSSDFGYDKVGNLTSHTDRDGRVTTFGYDALDRRTSETWLSGAAVVNDIAYTYDKVGDLLTADDAYSHYQFRYDALGRQTQADNSGTPGVSHVVLDSTYDAAGNRTAVQDDTGVRVASKYDAMDRLTSRSWSGGGVDPVRVEFSYDLRGGRTETRRYGSLAATDPLSRTTYTYDLAGQLKDIAHTGTGGATVAQYHATYDKAGQVSTETTNGQTTTFTYDAAGELTGATTPGGPTETFSYDLNGNRAGTTVGPGNELLSDGTSTFTYDNEGNVVRKTDVATGEYTDFVYDHRNRLVHATVKSAGGVVLKEVTNTYDAFDAPHHPHGGHRRGRPAAGGGRGDGVRRRQRLGGLRRERGGERPLPVRRSDGRDNRPLAAGGRDGVVPDRPGRDGPRPAERGRGRDRPHRLRRLRPHPEPDEPGGRRPVRVHRPGVGRGAGAVLLPGAVLRPGDRPVPESGPARVRRRRREPLPLRRQPPAPGDRPDRADGADRVRDPAGDAAGRVARMRRGADVGRWSAGKRGPVHPSRERHPVADDLGQRVLSPGAGLAFQLTWKAGSRRRPRWRW